MYYLLLKTDQDQAELYLYQGSKVQDSLVWLAERHLAETLNQQIEKLFNLNKIGYKDLSGIGVYGGPGSFTGLRIGISVANALAYGLNIPIVSMSNEDWKNSVLNELALGHNQKIAIPIYGSDARVTKPRK